MSLPIDKTVAFSLTPTLFIGNFLHLRRENSLQKACLDEKHPLSLSRAFFVTSRKVGGICIITNLDALFADRILQRISRLSTWQKESVRVLLGSVLVRLTSSWTFREALLFFASYRILSVFCQAFELKSNQKND